MRTVALIWVGILSAGLNASAANELSVISFGRALPPVTPVIISAPCRGARRLRPSEVTCGRPAHGGLNSGR